MNKLIGLLILSMGAGFFLSVIVDIDPNNFVVFEAGVMAGLVGYLAVAANIYNRKAEHRENMFANLLDKGWEFNRKLSDGVGSLVAIDRQINHKVQLLRIEGGKGNEISEIASERMGEIELKKVEVGIVYRDCEFSLIEFLAYYRSLCVNEESLIQGYEDICASAEKARQKLDIMQRCVLNETGSLPQRLNDGLQLTNEQNEFKDKLVELSESDLGGGEIIPQLKLDAVPGHFVAISMFISFSFGYLVLESIQ